MKKFIMKKFITSIIVAVVLFVCCFGIVGCNTNNKQISTSESPSNVAIMEKYIVDITMENYRKFITIETVPVFWSTSTSYYHYFSGALSYAFYDGVIVTYNYRSDGITEKTLTLNAGGCGMIATSSSKYGSSSYEITNVSGIIIYWI